MNTIDTSNESRAQLSALVDGELDAQASRFLLRRLDNDAELRSSWDRFHVAGNCLRRTPMLLLPDGFAERVSAALDAEQAPRRGIGAVARWTGGAAVAASVALLALLAARPTPEPAAPVPTIASTGAVAESPLREQDLRPDFSRIPAQTVAATQSRELGQGAGAGPGFLSDPRIEAYLVRHNQALQAQGRASFVPYVYVVAQPGQGTVRPAAVDGVR